MLIVLKRKQNFSVQSHSISGFMKASKAGGSTMNEQVLNWKLDIWKDSQIQRIILPFLKS
jgi:hypothetical protein